MQVGAAAYVLIHHAYCTLTHIHNVHQIPLQVLPVYNQSVSCRSAAHAHSKSPRPNYFLALQLSNSPAVIEAISRVQQSLIKHLPAVQAALVDPQSAHMTVMVAALQSEEEVQTAEKAMEALPAVLAQHGGMQGPLCVKLEGLSHFRHEVPVTLGHASCCVPVT